MTAIAGWISTEFYKGRHPEAFLFSSLTGLRVCDLEEETYQFYCSPRFCHDRQFFESALQLPLAISNDPFIPNGVGWPISQHNNTDNFFVIDKSVTLHNALVFQVVS
jgi:hypothetical protein